MKPLQFDDLIIFENNDYLLINKPPLVSTLDERDSTRDTVISLARKHSPSLQICHRLDKETSGILAVAKSPDAYRHLSMQFEHRQVGKIYHAVACGIHDLQDVLVNLPIAKVNKANTVRIDYQEGRPSETLFKTLQPYKKHTLVACMPLTGRMHQIRIHLACIKAPIVADTVYGGTNVFLSELKRKFNLKNNTEEEPLIKRVALHARGLYFTGMQEEEIKVEAPYPKDIRALITQLEKNA